MEFAFWVRKRHSSYSQSVLSTFSGDCDSLYARSLSTGTVVLDPAGCVRELWRALRCSVSWKAESISERSTSGGPSAISSALVPGRILRSAAWSRLLKSFCCSGEAGTGDSWSSGMGGGLGRRGDAGDVITADEYDRPGRESGRRNYVEGGV